MSQGNLSYIEERTDDGGRLTTQPAIRLSSTELVAADSGKVPSKKQMFELRAQSSATHLSNSKGKQGFIQLQKPTQSASGYHISQPTSKNSMSRRASNMTTINSRAGGGGT